METLISLPLYKQQILVFATQYSVSFISGKEKLFEISFEERLVSVKALKLITLPFFSLSDPSNKQPSKISIKRLESTVLVVVDEMLNWAIFGFETSQQQALNKKMVKAILTSKEVRLFDTIPQISNKDRKRLNCFINLLLVQESHTGGVLELQPNIVNYPGVLRLRYQKPDKKQEWPVISFSALHESVVKQSLKESMTFEFLTQEKELTGTFLMSSMSHKKQSKSQGPQFLKLYVHNQGGLYSIVGWTVSLFDYRILASQIMISNIQGKVQEVLQLFCSKSPLLVVNAGNKLIILDVQTQQLSEYVGHRFLSKGNTADQIKTICDDEFQITAVQKKKGIELKTKKLLGKLSDVRQVEHATDEKISCFYLLNQENSILWRQYPKGENPITSSNYSQTLVMSSDAARISEAQILRDQNKLNCVLAFSKRSPYTSALLKRQYLSSQPYEKLQLSWSHSMQLYQSDLQVISSQTNRVNLLITANSFGTLFMELGLEGDSQITLKNNSSLTSLFQTKERSLFFGDFPSTDCRVQVLSQRIVIAKLSGKDAKSIDIRALFSNVIHDIDYCIGLSRGNRVVLIVENQLHFFMTSKDSLKLERTGLVHCFDDEIEYIFAANTQQAVAVKFSGSSSIRLYYATRDNTLIEFATVNQPRPFEEDCRILKVHSMNIQINAINYTVSIVLRLNKTPLLLFVKDQPYVKSIEDLAPTCIEFSHLPLHILGNLAPLFNLAEPDRHWFVAQDVYISFPKSCVVDKQVTGLQVACYKAHNFTQDESQPPILGVFFKKNLVMKLTPATLELYQHVYGKFEMPTDLKSLFGWKVKYVFSRLNSKSTGITIQSFSGSYNSALASDLTGKGNKVYHIAQTFESEVQLPAASTKPPYIIFQAKIPLEVRTFKQLRESLYLLIGDQEVWLVGLEIKAQKRLSLALYSKFSLDNQEFGVFKNKMPRLDIQERAEPGSVYSEFSEKHMIRQIQTLLISDARGLSLLAVLFQSPLIVILEIDNLVFKIRQFLKTDESRIQCFLDNFKDHHLYLRNNAEIFMLSPDPTNQRLYQITRKSKIDLEDDIVFASDVDNWAQKERHFKLNNNGRIAVESVTTAIVKEFGQLQTTTTDIKGNKTTNQIYI